MGALEFFPNQTAESKSSPIKIETLLDISAKILQERIDIEANENDLTRVIKMGSSAGGARAKAVIAINHKTGEIRSGQINQVGFESSIIKLDGLTNKALKDPQGYTNIEYAYYLIAKDCDIDISPSKLLESEGRYHFITKRFDRTNDGSKLHLQTLCGLAHLDFNMPRLHSYETLFRIANRLELTMSEKEQIFKVMVFNVIGRNHDDHTKNFSFLMDKEGRWRLAPAYDLTYSYNPNNQWLKEHNLLINEKSSEIMIDDLMVYAKTFHIKKAKVFIENINEVFSRWKHYAIEAQVCKEKTKEIEKNILLF
jgi:serine/threonine-protein kinase HipA